MTDLLATAHEAVRTRPSPLPAARGPLSAALLADLVGVDAAPGSGVGTAADALALAAGPDLAALAMQALAATDDVMRDDDVQLALFCLYELHHAGLEGVDDDREWDPRLLAVRGILERAVEAALRERVTVPELPEPTSAGVAAALFALTSADSGPSLSRFVAKKASVAQLRELLVQRSVYTLGEADPHSWAIPRLRGRAKAALVEIQADEYGGGRPERVHATIFGTTLRGVGLDDRYGAYLDDVPAITLASSNTMSLFGLHRRLRGAIVGHLAAFEMTSSIPSRLYASGIRRLGFGDDVAWYYDEHVEADAVHEQIAAHDLAGGLVESEPHLLGDVLFGAAACLEVEGWVGTHVLSSWTAGRSSLRPGSTAVADAVASSAA
ncbi:iron-containing redox enzyme family protein [Clavibacter sp. Sh2141]|uniref:iron-containing redox enzyme family protein n=1 Tax=Clavibacter sp. Sh2141 TaxID=3395374 RepID=UPI0039BCA6B7